MEEREKTPGGMREGGRERGREEGRECKWIGKERSGRLRMCGGRV